MWFDVVHHGGLCVFPVFGALHTKGMSTEKRFAFPLPPGAVTTGASRAHSFRMERFVLITVGMAVWYEVRAAGMLAWCVWSARHQTHSSQGSPGRPKWP